MPEHLGLEIEYARELGDTAMVRAAAARSKPVQKPMPSRARSVATRPAGRCWARCLDPDANANVAKVTRLLWEGLGFGWGQTTAPGVTFLGDALLGASPQPGL